MATFPVLSFLPSLTQVEGQFKVIQLGSLNVFLVDYLLLILAIVICIVLVRTYNTDRVQFKSVFSSPITKIVFFFFLWNLFIGILSYIKGYQPQNVIRILSPEFTAVIVIFLPLIKNIEAKKESFLNYCVVLGVILAIFGTIRYFVTNEIELTSSGTLRTLLDYTINIFIFPICYILFYGKFWQKNYLLGFFAFLLLGLGINLTGHRSGWLVLFFVIALFFLSPSFNKRQYIWIPFFSVGTILSIILFAPYITQSPGNSFFSDILIRVSDTFDWNNKTTVERLDKWSLCLEIVKEKPILGLGRLPFQAHGIDLNVRATNRSEAMSNMHLRFFSEFDKDAHNLIATRVAHQGISGLIALLAFFYFIFQKITIFQPNDYNYAFFMKSYILAFILMSMFNPTFNSISCKVYFYSILGFLNHAILSEQKYDSTNTAVGRRLDKVYRFQ